MDKPKLTALSLFLHPSPPTYTFLLSLMLHIKSILSMSCDFSYCISYSVACIMLQLFVHLRHPLLFILLLVPLVTMSQSVNLLQYIRLYRVVVSDSKDV